MLKYAKICKNILKNKKYQTYTKNIPKIQKSTKNANLPIVRPWRLLVRPRPFEILPKSRELGALRTGRAVAARQRSGRPR